MSDLEPTVTFKPSDNQVTINETDNQATNSLEEQEIRDKIEPIKASKLHF